jgi:two-component system cell cycle sensor histidine kinase/response regulator CckA
MSLSLKRGGHSVLEAESGQEALRLMEGRQDIPVMVTDFCMPGMNGIELVRSIRTCSAGVKAVLLSGYWIHPLPEDLDVEFITKPFSMSRLVAKVNQLLAR